MKIVFDTNVILSAMLTQGLCARVLDVSIDRHQLFISPWIIDEVKEKLITKFKVPRRDLQKAMEFIKEIFEKVTPRRAVPAACHDKDDNNILHLAEYVKADAVVTGDNDLLRLKNYKLTAIITPRQFMEEHVRRE